MSLISVTDAAGVVNSSDIGSSSYSYDAIGNLLTDAAEGITNIDWTVYGLCWRTRNVVKLRILSSNQPVRESIRSSSGSSKQHLVLQYR